MKTMLNWNVIASNSILFW